ncbi:MAG: hypothetical protein ACI8Z7_000192 [Candidatus Nanohaloarchaea archaeon]|jgi:hypothetical protein
MNKIKVDGTTKEVQEEGETIWLDEDYIQRPKISDQSRKELVNAIENQNWESAFKQTFEIMTGQTVEEAKN